MPERATKPTADDLALLVASGDSVGEAAAKLGVARRTAYNWRARDDFKAAVAEHRRAKNEQAIGKLAHAATKAVETIIELAESSDVPVVRLNAARVILDNLMKLRAEAVEGRLDEIEAKLNAIAQVPA